MADRVGWSACPWMPPDMSGPRFSPLRAAFLLAVSLLIGVAWLSWWHTTRAVEMAALLASSHRIRDDIAQLQASILDLQFWQRTHLPETPLPSLQPLEDGLVQINGQQRA